MDMNRRPVARPCGQDSCHIEHTLVVQFLDRADGQQRIHVGAGVQPGRLIPQVGAGWPGVQAGVRVAGCRGGHEPAGLVHVDRLAALPVDVQPITVREAHFPALGPRARLARVGVDPIGRLLEYLVRTPDGLSPETRVLGVVDADNSLAVAGLAKRPRGADRATTPGTVEASVRRPHGRIVGPAVQVEAHVGRRDRRHVGGLARDGSLQPLLCVHPQLLSVWTCQETCYPTGSVRDRPGGK